MAREEGIQRIASPVLFPVLVQIVLSHVETANALRKWPGLLWLIWLLPRPTRAGDPRCARLVL